ncbi:MAG: DnaA regulatory inactivator Hda [Gammaproteobacteria bacterium]|jgi:DnaA family protein
MRQLPLPVRLRDFALFETFEPGPNGAVVAVLAAPVQAGPAVWVWGPAGSGKSHLLQAACAEHARAAYLPAADLRPGGPETLAGWEERELVCVDDVDLLLGERPWELALFGLFNALWERQACLVVSASSAPASAGFVLPDLASRLAWGGVFRLELLDDEGRIAALRRRARYRGLELPEDVARYLLRRLPRDMRALCGWLDRLDTASLAAGRRLTMPFVREVIAGGRPEHPA